VTRRTSRPGYTLLEILVASVIGLLLMAALYVAFSVIISDTSVGRDLTAESNLSRGIINRVGIDLGSPVGVLGPKSGGDPAASGGGSAATDASATTSASTGTAVTDTSSTDTGTAAVTPGANVPFQAGVVGTGDQLIIYLTRSPDYLRKRGTATATAVTPDLVKVTYYLHSSGKGLCRKEEPWVTGEGVWNSTAPDRGNEDGERIAPEVVNVQFEYASGSGYTSDWDGSIPDATGAACQGPPRAVRMTLTLEFVLKDGTTTTKDVTHVYPLRSAVGTGSFANAGPNSTASGTAGGSTTPTTGGAP
jgi:prepilin-type N-terminal cleavage/methylation domain-containing protein